MRRESSTCRSIVGSTETRTGRAQSLSPSVSLLRWSAFFARYPQLRNAIISSATMLTILIIGLIAGPAVSL